MAVLDRRIGWIFVAFLALLAVALIRAADLGVVKAGSLQQAAVTQQITRDVIPAERGTITDRNGVQLAISESADDVAADPYLIKKLKSPLAAAQKLAPLLGKPVLTVLGLLTEPHRGFVYLAHLLPADRATAIMKLQLNGISISPQVTRVYPRAWTAAQVLGTVGWHDKYQSGLEYQYNAQLKGTDGVREIVNDAIGQPISIDDVHTMQAGKTLKLTLDAALQDEVEQVLAGVGAQYSPKGATAIVMNPNTGAIQALANWPRVDANDPGAAPLYAQEDRAVSFNYEPGSTFKAITVAGALQDGLVTPSTQFNVPSMLQVADRQIHDAESHPDEVLSVAQILKVSSNIGADEIGAKLGAARFSYWVRRFGFGAKTGVDLPGEDSGIILPLSKYSGSSMGNLPFGQGESVTPIQIATAYSAIANGGILRPPRIVAAIGGKATRLPVGHRVISNSTSAELRDMLRGVLADGGTASGAAIPGYDLAGKTGTANVVVNGKYSSSEFIASFIGMVPARAPKLVVAVMVDEPQGSIYGGSVAAPAFQKIVG
ncbi:MAG: peptidoglycan D,D-transpeptidase FtsI family protein, partial [Solirubrobacteraceae bacterium]